MRIATASCCEQGGRVENEDTILLLEDPKMEAAVLIVADGLGGHGGGAAASQIATRTLAQGFLAVPSLSPEDLVGLFESAGQAVCAAQQVHQKMMTTAAALFFYRGSLAGGYVGDSRIYCFQNGKILYQSIDHSVPQMEVYTGEITPDQIRFHPDRNRLLRALGSDRARPDIVPSDVLAAGEAFLLCTDGFWEYVNEEVMERALQSAATVEEWLGGMRRHLDQVADLNRDNASAIAVFLIP